MAPRLQGWIDPLCGLAAMYRLTSLTALLADEATLPEVEVALPLAEVEDIEALEELIISSRSTTP